MQKEIWKQYKSTDIRRKGIDNEKNTIWKKNNRLGISRSSPVYFFWYGNP